jgi:3-oxoacyl-[acyl-carrier protein] reductase
MDLGIKGKTAIVAAASQGLGKASALSLAREGVNLVICSRNKKDITHTADEIASQTSAIVKPFVADVSQPSHIKKFVQFANKTFGTVHIVVNNAGGPPTGDFLELDDDKWKQAFELTMLGTVRLTRAVLPGMIEQSWGRVITIVSIAAKQPITDLLLSSAMRPGILGLMRVLSNKHASSNITFNTVCPGYVLTQRLHDLMQTRATKAGVSLEAYLKGSAQDIPLGRLGKPEEIGDVVAFLASERASYVSGVNMLVDGGSAKGIY